MSESIEHQRAGLIEMPRTISKLITLRYLDLSMNKFTKLPDSLAQLVNLLCLNLSFCRELQELPRGLSKLTNLVSLDLVFYDSLQELARDMSKLVKLRELCLLECRKLRHMPMGLGNCTGLERLEVFVAKGPSSSWTIPRVSDDYKVGGLAELNRLNNLEGTLTIKVDGKWSSESEARAANLQGKEKLTGLQIEFVGGSSGDNEVMLKGFQPNANLRELTIEGYKGERIPSWIHDMDYRLNLEEIMIYNWKTQTCICLGSFGRLPRLKILVICHSLDLEYIKSTTTVSSTSSHEIMNVNADIDPDPNASYAVSLFPSLEYLILGSLPKLKGWMTMCASSSSSKNGCFSRGVGATTFPRLKSLKLSSVGLEVVPEEFQGFSSLVSLAIEDCNLLKGIPEWIETLASIEVLDISNCPQLTSSPEQMVKLSNFDFERHPRRKGAGWLRGKRRGNGSTSSSNFQSL